MADAIIIKEIDGEGIWLKEVNIDRYTWIYYALTFLWISMGMGAILLEIIDKNIFAMPTVGMLLGFISIFIIQLVFRIGVISKPAYEVYLVGGMWERVIIEKTTSLSNQIAVCKAVQELELKLRERIQRKCEMEQIASKCK